MQSIFLFYFDCFSYVITWKKEPKVKRKKHWKRREEKRPSLKHVLPIHSLYQLFSVWLTLELVSVSSSHSVRDREHPRQTASASKRQTGQETLPNTLTPSKQTHRQIFGHPPAPALVAGVDVAAAPPSAAAVASAAGAGVAKASEVHTKCQDGKAE